MEATTCFGLYWPSSDCLGNLRASDMHEREHGVEISTYAYLDKPNQNSQIKHYEAEQIQIVILLKFPRQPDDGQNRPKHVVASIA